jgi:hypothetical protein
LLARHLAEVFGRHFGRNVRPQELAKPAELSLEPLAPLLEPIL